MTPDEPKDVNEPFDKNAPTPVVPALENIFTYWPPTGQNQIDRYGAIRDAAKEFAYVVYAACPPSADRTAAIRKIREAVMTANASIALENHDTKL